MAIAPACHPHRRSRGRSRAPWQLQLELGRPLPRWRSCLPCLPPHEVWTPAGASLAVAARRETVVLPPPRPDPPRVGRVHVPRAAGWRHQGSIQVLVMRWRHGPCPDDGCGGGWPW